MGITISTLDFSNEIKDKLQQKLGQKLIFAEEESKGYTLFKIDFEQNKKINALEYIAGIIADIVIDILEIKFITRIIRHKYQQFSGDERDKIQELTLNRLNEEGMRRNKLRPDEMFNKLVRKQEVMKEIQKYFNKNQDINIEGFVRFRLKDYISDLNCAVEEAVDDYIIEKEYNEFIELLKYFVDLQEPRISMVHVLKKEDQSFQIYDKLGNKINNEYLEGYLSKMFDEDVEHEDLLVSALINVAPVKIILHFDDSETEETVKKIFGDRVEVCTGCQMCKKD